MALKWMLYAHTKLNLNQGEHFKLPIAYCTKAHSCGTIYRIIYICTKINLPLSMLLYLDSRRWFWGAMAISMVCWPADGGFWDWVVRGHAATSYSVGMVFFFWHNDNHYIFLQNFCPKTILQGSYIVSSYDLVF